MRKTRWREMPPSAEIIRLYRTGLSQAAVGRIMDVSQTYVGDVLRVLDEPIHPRRRRWTLDETYFDQIDTPEKAYWLGFLAADGFIRRDRRTLGLRLKASDEGHVAALAAALGSDAPIKDEQGGRQILFGSKHMVESLAGLGITRRKTTACRPWDGPADLMPHYWRGALDGDGHIGKAEAIVSYCGTRPMVEAFRAFAQATCGTKANAYLRVGMWVVSINGGRQVPILVKALYGIGGPVLERKMLAAQAVITRYPPRVKRTCSEEGCGGAHVAHGLCAKHYREWRKEHPSEQECSIGTCHDPVLARGWCEMHYARWARTGNPLGREALATPSPGRA